VNPSARHLTPLCVVCVLLAVLLIAPVASASGALNATPDTGHRTHRCPGGGGRQPLGGRDRADRNLRAHVLPGPVLSAHSVTPAGVDLPFCSRSASLVPTTR
jgi:hypothetical protein